MKPDANIEKFRRDLEVQAQLRSQKAVETIEKLATEVDAAQLFISMCGNLIIGPADGMTETYYGTVPVKLEQLAFCLYPFFSSFPSSKVNITTEHINICTQALENLHNAYIATHSLKAVPDNPVDLVLRTTILDAMLVRGSAYQEQTALEIEEIQGKFESWFEHKIGIGPVQAKNMILALFQCQNDSVPEIVAGARENGTKVSDAWVEAKRTRDVTIEKPLIIKKFRNKEEAGLFGFSDKFNSLVIELLPKTANEVSKTMSNPPSQKVWEKLFELIGLTTDRRKELKEQVDTRHWPLYILPDGKLLVIDIAHTLDVLWERFEEVAQADPKFFQEKYQRHRAKWLEDKTFNYLARLFPKSRIYRSLHYPDLAKPGKATAELDIAIEWGPFLILLEVKAKQFRLAGQLGDVGRLISDLKINIQDAFTQAKRAVSYIDVTPSPEFVEHDTGRKLRINKSNLRRIYILTVSQHNLARLATDKESLASLKIFKDNEYPFSISIADLDLVTEVCPSSEVFLHYIERRMEALKFDFQLQADEIELFGAYLDTRLQLHRFGQKEGPEKFDLINLGGWQDEFDKLMMFKRGDISTKPELGLSLPPEIEEILLELKRLSTDKTKWISFALLDMSDTVLGNIARALQDVKQATNFKPGFLRRMSYSDDNIVVNIVASFDLSPQSLYEKVKRRTIVEKYRRKASKSIGFGVMLTDTAKPFEYVIFEEGAWEYDESIENELKNEPFSVPMTGQKLPGRNELCLCGSGKKFKKCCLDKVEFMRNF